MRTLDRIDRELIVPQLPLESLHYVSNIIWGRFLSNSQRGQRDDGLNVALAVEGGGHAGIFTAGMCSVLEVTGLIDAIDIIYGTSSGALNGSFTAAGQARIGSSNYEDTANRRFSNPMRLLMRKSVLDLEFLFDDVIKNRKPYDSAGLKTGPEFRAVATNLDTKRPEVLKDFEDVEDMMNAVRASCSVPFMSEQRLFRSMRLVDGGLTASIPFREALKDGATHVLALRSKSLSYHSESYSPSLLKLINRFNPELGELIEKRPDLYNSEAEHLKTESQKNRNIGQVVIPDNALKVSRLEHSVENVRQGFYVGAVAMASAIGLPELNVLWQPTIYLKH